MRTRLGLALLLLACKPAGTVAPPAEPTAPPAAPPNPWTAPPAVPADRLERHLAFLADDAQEGRAPGTAADQRVQQHIEAAFKELGLQPGFGASFVQPFAVTDGVRLIAGKTAHFKIGKADLAIELVPWSHPTTAAVEAPLVYIGHGVSDDPKLAALMKGAIVVARAGAPQDPHLDPTRTRAQNKLIAARDRGAVGFVLWDPDNDLPYPNHGEANDLTIPAVAVGKAGTPALLAAFGSRQPATLTDPHAGIVAGKKARAKAALHTPVERVVLTTANVAGVLPGAGPRRIVLGAHMDHLGLGTASSLAPGQTAVHNGADDNASGVAAMLALADALRQVAVEHRPYTVQFVAFGAEEMGLLGSKHLVTQLSDQDRQAIVAMLNFDMVGRLQNDSVVVSGVGTSSAWPKLLERAAAGGLTIRPSEDGFGASDQTSFYAAGIPVLHFFSGTHGDYHKPSDDLDKINIPGAVKIGDLTLHLIGLLMQDQPRLDYVKVAAASPSRGGFRVSLGTIPDYAAKVDGVQITEAKKGGPAEAAGLKSGDIITKLGAREIHNFDDYMACFSELQPGAEVPIVIRRGDQTLDLKITPAAPSRR
jgi:aminopeptidase YwaD